MNSIYFIIRPYLRGMPIIIATMILAYIVADKYLGYVTPMYESTAKIRLADIHDGLPNSNLYKDLDIFASSQKINAEIEILKSSYLIQKALSKLPFEVVVYRSGNIRKTELFGDSPITIQYGVLEDYLKDKDFYLNINESLELKIISPNGNEYHGKIGDTTWIGNSKLCISINDSIFKTKKNIQLFGDYIFTFLSIEKQVEKINANLDIMAVEKEVPVIRISFKSSNPLKAAMLPNILAQTYIEDYLESKNSAAKLTVSFLEERIKQITDKLDWYENQILEYRKFHNITNINQETETGLRKISQMEIQQTNLKMSLEAIRELESYVENGMDNFLELAPNFEAFSDLLSTEIIKKIKNLQAEKKDLLLKYTEKEGKVLLIDQKINDLKSYIRESIINTRKNLEVKYNELSSEIVANEDLFLEVPEKERTMTILNREFEIYQKNYNYLNQKKIEAEILEAVKVSFHKVITKAIVNSKPVSPNRTIIKIVSTILGMFGALLLIFIIHTLKARVSNPSDIEKNSVIPIVSSIPFLKNETEKQKFFLKLISDWEARGFLKDKQWITLSGFKLNHGVLFIANQLIEALKYKPKKVIVIQIVSESDYSEDIWQEKILEEKFALAHVSVNNLQKHTIEGFKSLLNEKTKDYDHTIIINSELGEVFSVPLLTICDFNFICLDTRLTPLKLVTEMEFIKDSFKLDNLGFLINRVGYNPSIFRGFKKNLVFLKHKFKP